MNKIFRSKALSPIIRFQYYNKNIPGVELPKQEREVQRTGFKPGDRAPFAYQDIYEYPKDYRPWTFNYRKNNALYACLFFSFASLYFYEEQKQNRQHYVFLGENKAYAI
mmetsp:Transcript_32337/g.29160  ORF Transcript_32337/g.29160 Transcript_32337/m.29160 type:complete len:109 (+) Transcript_32337:59-385(+)